MPLPLAIPFLLKGAVVVAKALSAKGAATAAAKGAVVAVKTVGVKTTIAATATTVIGIGALQWSYERFLKAKTVLTDFGNENYAEAATGLVSLISSFSMVDGNHFVDEGRQWIAEGASITSSHFDSLVSDVKSMVDEMIETGRTPLPG